MNDSAKNSRDDAGADAGRGERPRDRSAASRSSGGQSEERNTGKLADLANRRLGDFRLLRRLGRGGMAEVYLAEQTTLRRRAAVKVLRPELVADETHLRRFEQEAVAAGGLNHPNIVQVYTVGESDGFHYIAQEYVSGLNLHEYLRRKGPPDARLAMHVLRQVASALAAADDAGIVHRDIKPENILITRKGDIKVADFGLAQLAGSGRRPNLTQDGTTMGTPLYMAPEQINGEPLDIRTDIYSLGVTSYHLLCGRPPFEGETGMSVAVRHLHEQPTPLATRRPDLPAELCAIVERMMEKKPEDRFPDARSLAEELRIVARKLRDSQPGSGPIAADERAAAATNSAEHKLGLVDRFFEAHLSGRLAVVLISCLLAGTAAAAIGWWLRPASPL